MSNRVTILDTDSRTHQLTFDLRDILALIGEKAIRSTWLLSEVESIGGHASDVLNRISDEGRKIDGAELISLSRRVSQIVDGTFEAFDKDVNCPWITIQAVDSSAYDVITEDQNILNMIRKNFFSVEDIPS